MRFIIGLLVCLLALPVANAYAMKLSAVGAMVSSQPAETTQIHDANSSLGAGVLLELGMVPMIGLELGALSISRKSSQTVGTTTTMTKKELYEFPVLLRVNLGSMLSFGFGGYYARYQGKIFEEATTGASVTSAEYAYSDKFATQHDYGLATSLALYFPLAPLAKFMIDGRYTMGLRDNDTRETYQIKYNDYQVLAGLQVGF